MLTDMERKARAAASTRRYRERHPDRVKEQNRTGADKRKIDPVYKEKHRNRERARRASIPEDERREQHAKRHASRMLNPEYVESERLRNLVRTERDKKANGARLRDYVYGAGAQNHFEKSLAEQDGKCAVCKEVLDMGYNTHFDHNHDTGQWRSVLCGGCNAGLGNFRENPNHLLNAIAYLSKWNQGSLRCQ